MLQIVRWPADAYQGFSWQPRKTPLSTPASVITLVMAYLVVIAMGRQIFSKPVKVPTALSAGHNLVLCVGSLVMLLGTAWESVQVPCEQHARCMHACIQCMTQHRTCRGSGRARVMLSFSACQRARALRCAQCRHPGVPRVQQLMPCSGACAGAALLLELRILPVKIL